MRGVGIVVGLFALTAVAACGGGGNDESSSSATTIRTTTTSPFVRPAPCINAMKAADDVFEAQDALDTNYLDIDKAIVELGNAVDDGAAQRAAAQSKVDTATQKDATLRSQLTVAQSRFESLSADCTTELGSRSLTAGCQGMLDEARA